MASREATNNIPVLFSDTGDCCGCESCLAACPKGAISMVEDDCGFTFPHIDVSLCVGCHACVRACGLHQRLGQKTSGPWYAAAGKGDVSRSASAGVFVTLARKVIMAGGAVFGAAYELEYDGLHVRHCMVEGKDELIGLQNSKYVQSDAGPCFPEVRSQLKSGRPILFCGTPCQIAGLHGFLGGRQYPNLYTADLVCHGVPSQKMFRDWTGSLERKYGGRVTDVRFRSKRDGWNRSLLLQILIEGHEEPEYMCSDDSDYYQMFLGLETLRDSCYRCPYAGSYRAADITLGDFWGVEVNAPEVLQDEKHFNMKRGVSCLLVNNAHGLDALEKFGDELALREISFDAIAKGNDQLRHPSITPKDRDQCLAVWRKGGWSSVSKWWKLHHVLPQHTKLLAKSIVKRVMPKSAIESIKRFRG